MINLHLKINENIELKIPTKDDVSHVFLLVMKNREWLGKYMDWEAKTQSPKDILAFFERAKHLSYYDDNFPLIIWYKKKIVGIIGFNRGNSIEKHVEIGYWIEEKYSRKGIATKATKALVNFAFNMTDIETIFIHCEISNIPSYKIPQKLGFKFIKEEENSDIFYRAGKAVKLTDRLDKNKEL